MSVPGTLQTDLRPVADELRWILAHFATGVTVVAAAADGELGGMTVNAFLSLSMAPPLVGVCLSQRARTHALVHAARAFAVSILSDSQTETAQSFARPHSEKTHLFEDLEWTTLNTGAPVLADARAAVDCIVVSELPIADHTLFVGRPVAAAPARPQAAPLIFFARQYGGIR